MADTASTPTPADVAPKVPTDGGHPATTANPNPQPAEDTDWKAEARKWQQRAQENFEARKRLNELEESQKSEAEKVADRLRQAQEEAQQARADAARFRIAAEHRLSTEDAELLTGDEDAMKRLAARLAAAAEASASPRTPRPNPAQREGDAPADDKDAQARAFFGIS